MVGLFSYSALGGAKIVVQAVSPSGEQTTLQEVDVRPPDKREGVKLGNSLSLATSPDRRFLYAANRTAPFTIRSFSIRPDGTLALLGDAPIVESSPFISTDQTGRFLFIAGNPGDRMDSDGYVSVCRIHNGFVQRPHQVIHTPPKTHSVLIDYSNRFVLAPSTDGDVISRFSFNAQSGLLNPDRFAPIIVRTNSGPRHLRFHPNNRFVYTCTEAAGGVYVHSLEPRDGSMSEIQCTSALPADFERDAFSRVGEMHITPNGQWLYVAVRSVNALAAFKVDDESGRIILTGHYPVGEEPRGFNIDARGRYLIVNGRRSRTSETYLINQETGALTKLAESKTSGPPDWIEIVELP